MRTSPRWLISQTSASLRALDVELWVTGIDVDAPADERPRAWALPARGLSTWALPTASRPAGPAWPCWRRPGD